MGQMLAKTNALELRKKETAALPKTKHKDLVDTTGNRQDYLTFLPPNIRIAVIDAAKKSDVNLVQEMALALLNTCPGIVKDEEQVALFTDKIIKLIKTINDKYSMFSETKRKDIFQTIHDSAMGTQVRDLNENVDVLIAYTKKLSFKQLLEEIKNLAVTKKVFDSHIMPSELVNLPNVLGLQEKNLGDIVPVFHKTLMALWKAQIISSNHVSQKFDQIVEVFSNILKEALRSRSDIPEIKYGLKDDLWHFINSDIRRFVIWEKTKGKKITLLELSSQKRVIGGPAHSRYDDWVYEPSVATYYNIFQIQKNLNSMRKASEIIYIKNLKKEILSLDKLLSLSRLENMGDTIDSLFKDHNTEFNLSKNAKALLSSSKANKFLPVKERTNETEEARIRTILAQHQAADKEKVDPYLLLGIHKGTKMAERKKIFQQLVLWFNQDNPENIGKQGYKEIFLAILDAKEEIIK